MPTKLEYTPNSRIKSALRQLWLRSRERAKTLKMANYTCSCCGVKQSKAKGKEVKVEVHHREGILNWLEVYRVIREQLLCEPDKMEVLCPKCHKEKL